MSETQKPCPLCRGEPEELAERLEAVWNALDRSLGDTDADWYESEEELHRDDPLLWATQQVGLILRRIEEPTGADHE